MLVAVLRVLWIQSNLEKIARNTVDLKVPIRSHNPIREGITGRVCALGCTNNIAAVDNCKAEKEIVGD